MSSADGPGVHLTRLGHACVLVTVDLPDGEQRRLLLDPGNLTPPLTPDLGPVDAVLVTHAHADHVDPDQVRRLPTNTPVYGDDGVLALLADAGFDHVRLAAAGSSRIADVPVLVAEASHEVIYPGAPVPTNLAYLLAGTVLAPGDAFFVPDNAVEVLLLPIGAPWMKLAEGIDYLRAVGPRVAVLVHDGGLAAAHQDLHRAMLTRFAPPGTTVVAPDLGRPFSLGTIRAIT